MLESIYAEAIVDYILRNDALLVGPTALNGPYVYKNKAEQDAPFPHIIFNVQDPDDFLLLNRERLFSEYGFQLRTVGYVLANVLQEGPRVRATANRMDDLFKRNRRVSFVVDGQSFSVNTWRERELPVREEQGITPDTFLRVYGGIYRVQLF